jgi:hypothetical protein
MSASATPVSLFIRAYNYTTGKAQATFDALSFTKINDAYRSVSFNWTSFAGIKSQAAARVWAVGAAVADGSRVLGNGAAFIEKWLGSQFIRLPIGTKLRSYANVSEELRTGYYNGCKNAAQSLKYDVIAFCSPAKALAWANPVPIGEQS